MLPWPSGCRGNCDNRLSVFHASICCKKSVSSRVCEITFISHILHILQVQVLQAPDQSHNPANLSPFSFSLSLALSLSPLCFPYLSQTWSPKRTLSSLLAACLCWSVWFGTHSCGQKKVTSKSCSHVVIGNLQQITPYLKAKLCSWLNLLRISLAYAWIMSWSYN